MFDSVATIMAHYINCDLYRIVEELDRTLNNALAISIADREMQVMRYGEELVSFVEKQSEFWGKPEHHIQNSLNIAYDKGFTDCVEMVQRVLSGFVIQEAETHE